MQKDERLPGMNYGLDNRLRAIVHLFAEAKGAKRVRCAVSLIVAPATGYDFFKYCFPASTLGFLLQRHPRHATGGELWKPDKGRRSSDLNVACKVWHVNKHGLCASRAIRPGLCECRTAGARLQLCQHDVPLNDWSAQAGKKGESAAQGKAFVP